MGHGDDRARVLLEMAFEPRHRLGVEMVGRLVEQQQVGLLQQQPAERDAALLAARKRLDLRVAGRAAQRVHRDLERAVEFPALHGVDPVLQLALLFEQRVHLVVAQRLRRSARRPPRSAAADRGSRRALPRRCRARPCSRSSCGSWERKPILMPGGRTRFAEEVLVDARHDAQQRTLAGAVGTDDADLRAGQEGQGDPVEDDAIGADHLAESRSVKMNSATGPLLRATRNHGEAARSLTVRRGRARAARPCAVPRRCLPVR